MKNSIFGKIHSIEAQNGHAFYTTTVKNEHYPRTLFKKIVMCYSKFKIIQNLGEKFV